MLAEKSPENGKTQGRNHRQMEDHAACMWACADLCENVGEDARQHMLALAELVYVPKHRILFEEGAPVESVYCLTNGVMKLYKALSDGRRQILEFCYKGDFLGPLGNGDGHTCSCAAITPVTVCMFRKSLFSGVLRAYPEIKDRLLDHTVTDITAAYEHIMRLGVHRSEEKLASFLMDLARRTGEKRPGGIGIYLPMQRSDIADYLGVKPETVSRAMAWLRDAGLVEVKSRHDIVLIRPDALALLARGSGTSELITH